MAAVLLNQPRPRAGLAAEKLKATGVEAVELSCHTLSPVAAGQQELAQLPVQTFDRVVFVSPSAVMFAEPELRGRLAAGQVAAIGQGTATVLVESGLSGDDSQILRPRQPPFDSAALMQLPAMQSGVIKSMLVVAGTQARTDWIAAAVAADIACTTVAVYRGERQPPDALAYGQLNRLRSENAAAVLVVGSVSEFQGLLHWLATLGDGQQMLAWLQLQPTVAPHGRIARQLTQAGWHRVSTTRGGQTLLDAALELAAH